MFQHCSSNLFHPLLPLLGPQVCTLWLYLCSCPANRLTGLYCVINIFGISWSLSMTFLNASKQNTDYRGNQLCQNNYQNICEIVVFVFLYECSRSNNFYDFKVAIHINNISDDLQQLWCDRRISVICIGNKATGTTNTSGTYCLPL